MSNSQTYLICWLDLKQEIPPVSEEDLWIIFSPFGNITNIRILAFNPIFKTVIQYSTQKATQMAFESLKDTKSSIGQINLTMSTVDDINQINHSSKDYHKMEKIFSQETFFNSIGRKEGSIFGKSNILPNGINSESSLFYKKDDKFQNSGNFIAPKSSTYKFSPQNLEEFCQQTNQKLNNFANYLFFNENATGLLYVNGISPHITKPFMLMNLFCCFGNVKQLLGDSQNGNCFVQYNNSAEATEAFNSLEGIPFFGKNLQMFICQKYLIKSEQKKLPVPAPLFTLVGLFNFHRFQSTLNIKYNRPISVLHLTNIPLECDHVILFMLISQVQEPELIIRMNRMDKKGCPMYLSVFKSVNQAIEVLTVLHNKNIQQRSIKVSFSAPRI